MNNEHQNTKADWGTEARPDDFTGSTGADHQRKAPISPFQSIFHGLITQHFCLVSIGWSLLLAWADHWRSDEKRGTRKTQPQPPRAVIHGAVLVDLSLVVNGLGSYLKFDTIYSHSLVSSWLVRSKRICNDQAEIEFEIEKAQTVVKIQSRSCEKPGLSGIKIT